MDFPAFNNTKILNGIKPYVPMLGILTLLGAGTGSTVYLQRKANRKLNRIERRMCNLTQLVNLAEDKPNAEIEKLQKALAETQTKYQNALKENSDKAQAMADIMKQYKQAVETAIQGARMQQLLTSYVQKIQKIFREKNIEMPELHAEDVQE